MLLDGKRRVSIPKCTDQMWNALWKTLIFPSISVQIIHSKLESGLNTQLDSGQLLPQPILEQHKKKSRAGKAKSARAQRSLSVAQRQGCDLER